MTIPLTSLYFDNWAIQIVYFGLGYFRFTTMEREFVLSRFNLTGKYLYDPEIEK